MTTALLTHEPVPVIGWDVTRDQWLAARRHGLGASDVAAALGLSHWHTPWQVWADKVDARRPDEQHVPAADLGTALEPWLIEQAAMMLDLPVRRTPFQLYAHPAYPWRMCSPDAWVSPAHLVQAKTAGLASGHGTPRGWDDGATPLGYELQCRWEMHVMGADRIDLVALVANRGLVRRHFTRDLDIEVELVAQVSDWWRRHVIEGVEPPLAASDSDLLARLYPTPTAGTVDLDGTDAVEWWTRYRDAHERETAAKADKDTAAAELKRLLGEHEAGRVEGRLIATWSAKRGRINWQAIATDLAQRAGLDLPDPETYRAPASRALSVKDL